MTDNTKREGRSADQPATNAKLEQAYLHAEALTQHHSKSFFLATRVLPPEQRRAMRALYGFCRYTDNLVDDPHELRTNSLDWWRAEVNRPWQDQQREVLIAWAHTRDQYAVPQLYSDELIEGCEIDLMRTRYATFQELERYCYCVASTVGLMTLHIIGVKPGVAIEQTHPYAIKLGIAMQMTNILRDVGEDLQRGRIYLPLEDLQRFKVIEDDIWRGLLNNRLESLLQFEIERTRQLYREAQIGIDLLSPESRFAVALAANMYQGILGKIVRNRYDVFTRRAYLTSAEKLIRVPLIWLRTRLPFGKGR